MRVILCLALMLSVSACGVFKRGGNGIFGNKVQRTLPYKAKLTSSKEDKRLFSVAVDAKGADLDAFRESARYPATRYCLYGYGSTRIDWDMDSTGTDWAVVLDGDKANISGRCVAR